MARSDAEQIAAAALEEDGSRDLTSEFTVPPALPGHGLVVYRSTGILAGTAYAEAVARMCGCAVEWTAADGDSIGGGTVVGTARGPIRGIFRAERPLLNLLQRACGIATATRAMVAAVTGTGCRILHTRKTAPGLRALDVAAVLAGGGCQHRLDLTHQVMVKDNHWRVLAEGARRLDSVLAEARRQGARELYVEVETDNQVEEACAAGATRLLIDNQPAETVRSWGEAARRRRPGIEIEATGGITLENARLYAEAGANFISVGALTHSVQAADLALDVRF